MLIVSCKRQSESKQLENIFRIEIYPEAEDKYAFAEFSIYIPSNVQKLKGIIVHQHGCGRNGLSLVYDYHWRALADKHNFALIGTHYIPNKNCGDWNNPANGSEKAFLKALDKFGEISTHSEISQVPWLLWGHSGGALWSCRMLDRFPEKVIGVFARSFADTFNEKGYQVPVIISPGRLEANHPRFINVYNRCLSTFKVQREQGALVALVVDPIAEHNNANSRRLAIPFFDECINAYKEKWDLNQTTVSKKINDIDTIEVQSVFLSNRIAKLCREYAKTGNVTDTTPPEPPFGLRVEQKGINAVEISFNANADLESGIKNFHLYRNGEFLKSFIGYSDDFNNKNFQYGNYGDEPVPESLYENVDNWIPTKMTFRDYRLENNKEYSYKIKMINWSDLESDFSPEISFTLQNDKQLHEDK